MKRIILGFMLTTALGISYPAWSQGHENQGEQNLQEISVAAVRTPEESLKVLQDGVAIMMDSVSEKNREEMFANGPIMEKWHEETVKIQEATETLQQHAATLPDDKKTRLEGALSLFSKALDNFHAMTHEKDAQKSVKEAKKVQQVLKLIETNLTPDKTQ